MNARLPIAHAPARLPVTCDSTIFPIPLRLARCRLLGHKIDHTRILGDRGAPCARCSAEILGLDNTVSHVAHTLSCFFGRHHYVYVASRTAHREYVCERCGHPLLYELSHDAYAGEGIFKKRVDYLCGLLGHRVHVVETRSKATEYACVCGHSFVKAERGITVIRHPLPCVLFGHFIEANEIRGEWAEYVCVRCGHPFCFKLAESIQKPRSHG